jgi:ABC-type multidrug transport system permease subunit
MAEGGIMKTQAAVEIAHLRKTYEISSRELMPAVLQDISNVTPLGAAVEAIQDSMQGQFPPAEPLLVLAGYALVFALIARRLFRWE